MAYFAVAYILWGVTYTMMDIPYWSMIPAVTKTPADRENLSVVGRTCAGVGSALIAMFTVALVGVLGGDSERAGFGRVALIVSVLFVAAEILCCAFFKENSQTEMETAGVKEMFAALLRNDQAMVVVASIVLINSALYLTSNFIIYFFKYDFGGAGWKGSYTLFSTVGGAAQILGMMVVYPLLRRKLSNTRIFAVSLISAFCAYVVMLAFLLAGLSGYLPLLLIPGVVVFICNGMLSVLTTLFLSNSVDYGQLKTGRREESVIFSMQTFVVKAASGVAVFLTGIGLDLIGLAGNTDEIGPVAVQSAETLLGLRLMMTVLPMIVLAAAFVLFRKSSLSPTNGWRRSATSSGPGVAAMDKLLRWRALVGGRALTGVVDGPDGAVRIRCDAPAGTIQAITAILPWEMGKDGRTFLNGYQTWTYCPECGKRDKIRGLAHVPKPLLDKYAFDRYGDYHFVDYPNKRGLFHGFSWCYFRRGSGSVLSPPWMSGPDTPSSDTTQTGACSPLSGTAPGWSIPVGRSTPLTCTLLRGQRRRCLTAGLPLWGSNPGRAKNWQAIPAGITGIRTSPRRPFPPTWQGARPFYPPVTCSR